MSGKLFDIYFENALKEVREVLSGMEKTPTMLPDEAIYADDADFITQELEKKEKLQNNIKNTLQKENLKVNETKTEETMTERKRKVQGYSCELQDDLKMIIKKDETENWRTTKKLGSLLGVTEDINRRKQLATAALNKMNNIWIRKDKIKQSS